LSGGAFGYASRMFSARNALIGLIAVFALGIAYWAWGNYQKKSQHEKISGLVAQGTVPLKAVLSGSAPTAAHIAEVEGAMKTFESTSRSRQLALAGAAEAYLISARAVILKRAEVQRLAPQAEASRHALTLHMNSIRGRSDSWIRRAAELKKKMDFDHGELDRQLRALQELIRTLPDAEKPLIPFVGRAVLVEDATRLAALKEVEGQIKRAADETQKTGRLDR
jgi:hypothetical protein